MATLDRYTLLRRVGAGGMAEIWKARTQGPAGFSKIVAIKRVLPDFAADEEFVEMFVEEAKLVARLVHPNIVQVHDFNQTTGEGGVPEYFITMEYVAGQNLSTILKRLKAPLPEDIALFVCAEAARGLAHAHDEADDGGAPLGIVHRDISPHNLLVSWKGEVKVADFGIAKVASVSRTATGIMKGKVAYMSPEQARMEALDRRSDLFSLGVVLWESLSGERLFSDKSSDAIYRKVVTFAAPDLSRFSEGVRHVLARSLDPDLPKRYPHAKAMETELLAALGTRAGVARDELVSLLAKLFPNEQLQESADGRVPPTGIGAAPAALDARSMLSRSDPSALAPAEGTNTWMRAVREAEANPALLTSVGGESVRGGTAMSPAPAAGDANDDANGNARGGTAVSAPAPSLTGALRKFGELPPPASGGSDAGGAATALRTPGDSAATALRSGIPAAPAPRPDSLPVTELARPVDPRPAPSQRGLVIGGAVAVLAIGVGLWLGGLVGGNPRPAPTSSPAVQAPSPTATATAPAPATKEQRLRALKNLFEDGTIPADVYQRRKQEILDEI